MKFDAHGYFNFIFYFIILGLISSLLLKKGIKEPLNSIKIFGYFLLI